jgi:polyferredoxin
LNLADWEGFDAWLWRSASLATITVAVVGLIASIFSPLAYCKFGCPTGALFKFLSKTSGTKHLSFRDLIAGLLCLAAFFS